MALAHNPAPKIAQSSVDASAAAVQSALSATSAKCQRQCRSVPRIEWDGIVPVYDTNAVTHAITSGTISTSYVTTPGNNASAGINANLLLYDFGKTPLQYAASGKSLGAARQNYEGTIQTTIVNARTAYYNYLLSLANCCR